MSISLWVYHQNIAAQHIITHGTVHIVKSTRYLKWNSTQRVNVDQSKHAIHLFKDSVDISRYTIQYNNLYLYSIEDSNKMLISPRINGKNK